MSLGHFLISRIFLKQLLLAAGIGIVLLFLAWHGLAIFTQHGKSFTMPDYTGLTLNDIEQFRIGKDLEFVVLDSVHNDILKKGSIITQDPLPGSMVKRNRKVYLTTVAILPEQVQMPDLVDLTFRQAVSSLETYGLRLGKLEYIPDIAKNAVLRQLYAGNIIEPGTLITKGSTVDLVLGQGLGSERIPLPFLLGLTQEEAHRKIKENFLNVGANIIESGNDTTARVYRQNPPWKPDSYIKIGQQIDLWYRSEEFFNFDSLTRLYMRYTIPNFDSIYYDTIY